MILKDVNDDGHGIAGAISRLQISGLEKRKLNCKTSIPRWLLLLTYALIIIGEWMK